MRRLRHLIIPVIALMTVLVGIQLWGNVMQSDETIVPASEADWTVLPNGWNRQSIFSGKLTMAVIEARGPEQGPILLHQHVHDQVTYLIDGEIEVQIGEEVRKIGPGGAYRVPSDVPHGIRVLSETARLIDAFTPPREDFR